MLVVESLDIPAYALLVCLAVSLALFTDMFLLLHRFHVRAGLAALVAVHHQEVRGVEGDSQGLARQVRTGANVSMLLFAPEL
jgi:hypothetical protein